MEYSTIRMGRSENVTSCFVCRERFVMKQSIILMSGKRSVSVVLTTHLLSLVLGMRYYSGQTYFYTRPVMSTSGWEEGGGSK